MKTLSKLLLVAITAFLALITVSCASVGAALTGAPIPTTPVQRVDGGAPFNVATSDVIRAETQPETKWGLYDAGKMTDAITEVVRSNK